MPELTPALRKRLYETAAAALLVAVGYGLIDGNQSVLWLGLVAAVLGVARVNVG